MFVMFVKQKESSALTQATCNVRSLGETLFERNQAKITTTLTRHQWLARTVWFTQMEPDW